MPVALTKKIKIQDRFQVKEGLWDLYEAKEGEVSEVDGTTFLAKLRGPMFLVNGTSLNNRFYSKTLWERALTDATPKIEEQGMFGVIGHDQELDEEAIKSGSFSHKVTKLWIDEKHGLGMGEILVLNSAAGRELNTLLRAGMKISVSSRAYGQFNGKTNEGADIIDPSSFYLETFDFVVNPGVSAACPRVVENISLNEERPSMDMEKILERLNSESVENKVNLTEALNKNAELSKKVEELTRANEKAEEFKAAITKKLGAEPVEALRTIDEGGLRKWLEIEPLKSIGQEVGLFDVNGYSLQQLSQKFVEALKTYAEIGSPKQIREKLKASKKYEAIGTIEDVTKLVSVLESYRTVGTVKEVNPGVDLLEKFMKVCKNPDSLTKMMEDASKVIAIYKDARKKHNAKKIADKFEVSEEAVVGLLEKWTVKETIEHFEKLTGSNDTGKRFKVTEEARGKVVTLPTKTSEKSGAMSLFESIKYNPIVNEPVRR